MAEVGHTPELRTNTARAHHRIAEAIAARDGDATRRASRQYLLRYRGFLEREQPELLARKVEGGRDPLVGLWS